jgi:hypothetical protein
MLSTYLFLALPNHNRIKTLGFRLAVVNLLLLVSAAILSALLLLFTPAWKFAYLVADLINPTSFILSSGYTATVVFSSFICLISFVPFLGWYGKELNLQVPVVTFGQRCFISLIGSLPCLSLFAISAAEFHFYPFRYPDNYLFFLPYLGSAFLCFEATILSLSLIILFKVVR